MSQHLAILEEAPLLRQPDRVYSVLPSRSHEGAVSILGDGVFLTGTFNPFWALQYAEVSAEFDRRSGIEAEVYVHPRVAGLVVFLAALSSVWVAPEATGEGA